MNRWMATCLLAAGTLLAASPASADIFQHHTGQADIEQRVVERPLVVGKGWVELGFGFDWKSSNSQFIAGDNPAVIGFTPGTHFERYDNDARLDFRTFSLNFRWGFTKGTDVYLKAPFVWNQLQNTNATCPDGSLTCDEDELTPVNVNTFALGDMEMGILAQLLRRQDPEGKFNNALGARLHIKAPTGMESPGSYIPSPGLIRVLPTGTGTYNFGLGVEFKQQLAIVAINLRAGYNWRVSGIAQYLIEDEEHQFALRIDPGDSIDWHAIFQFQMSRYFTLGVGARFDYRFATKIGPSSRGLAACKNCDPIEESKGLYMDGVAELNVTPDRSFQIDVNFAYTLGGRPAFLVPLEDISPTRGWTLGGDVMYRF